ncbi:hypothetical protein XH98_00520 [Bradyrhizobium sp. CCBAU 51745]|uniref:hypothetical protein n=1 Tax=Bradyrhizobium sp. CCBAU 51745 TaxID=1325099 RepID=UPI00230639EB|nr:hypothetical protein [Bradyrhizobium sp. CCBAU 51745]MDA9437621.1 hypothetical protein [Bradyrhizobium sp. CCBAU 51745]
MNNPLLVDYGPAGMKFQNAIRAILGNPDDPAFAPYVKDLYSAGVALQKGSDKALMASTIGAYLREGARNYQSNMSVKGDLATGIEAWKRLDPSTRNALLVQFYKQGPTPKLALKNAMTATQNGAPYVPRVGVDGAGATYLANEPAIVQALADEPASSPIGGMRRTTKRDLLPTHRLPEVPRVGLSVLRLMLTRKDRPTLTPVRPRTFRSTCGICRTRIACPEPAPKTCGF